MGCRFRGFAAFDDATKMANSSGDITNAIDGGPNTFSYLTPDPKTGAQMVALDLGGAVPLVPEFQVKNTHYISVLMSKACG